MKTLKIFSLLLATVFSLTLTSCNKEEEPEPQNIDYQVLAEDVTLSQKMSEDVFNTVDNESKNDQYNGTIGGKTSVTYTSVVDTCAIVTLNTNGGNWPMTLTIDFGTGCTDAYQVVRKGILTISYSAPYRDSGSVINIVPTNYYVNGYKVECTQVITNMGRNNNGNLTFKVKDQNGRITKPGGGIVTWDSERFNEWTEGENTILNFCDDRYEISGYLDGIASNGTSFRFESGSNDPLIKKVCCIWVQGGSLDVFVANVKVATIDYGDGTACDWNANLTYGGNTFVIVII